MRRLERRTVAVGISLLVPLLLLVSSGAATAGTESSSGHDTAISVVASIPLASESGMPTYDGANGNLYVPGGFGLAPPPTLSVVTIVSGATNTVTGTVIVGGNPWFPTVDSLNGDVYVPNSVSNNVSVISGTTGSLLATIPVGNDPTEVTFDPLNGNLYVSNQDGMGSSGSISVISGVLNQVVATIALDFLPGSVLGSNGDIYVGGGDHLAVISGTTNSVIDTISVTASIDALLYDPANEDLYAGTSGGLVVIPSSTNTVSQTLGSLGDPVFVDFSGNVYTLQSGDPANVSVISGTSNSVISTFPVGPASTVAYDPVTGDLFATNPEVFPGVLTVTSTSSKQILESVTLAPQGHLVEPRYDPGNGEVYVVEYGASNAVLVLGNVTPSSGASSNLFNSGFFLGAGIGIGILATAGVVLLRQRRKKN
jgi:YVTN family beta-propeller protein